MSCPRDRKSFEYYSGPRVFKIHVVRNNDSAFKGFPVLVKPEIYESFLSFRHDVTHQLQHHLPVPKDLVCKLLTENGFHTNSFDDIDEGTYTAIFPGEKFVYVPSITRYGSYTAINPNDTKFIIVIRSGRKPRQIKRLLLNKRNSPSFQQLFGQISQAVKFDSGQMHMLFNLDGFQAVRLVDLFGYHFIFIAYQKQQQTRDPEDLKTTEVEDRVIEDLITRSNTVRVNKIVPYKGSKVKPKIPPQLRIKYTLGEEIAVGGFSQVVKVYKNNGETCAMKIIDKSKYQSNDYHLLQNELAIMRLRLPNLLRLISVYDDPMRLYLVMDLLEGGDLYEAVKAERIPEAEAYSMTENLASALFYLHSVNYVHRDLKPTNIMVTSSSSGEWRELKLIDYGLASKAFGELDFVCGTTAFMAPEMLDGSGYSFKIDVWALGATVYFMLAGYQPFATRDDHDEDIRHKILQGYFDFDSCRWRTISEEAKELIAHMLDYDQHTRYTASQVLHHQWTQGCYTPVEPSSEGEWEDATTIEPASTAYSRRTQQTSEDLSAITMVAPSEGQASSSRRWSELHEEDGECERRRRDVRSRRRQVDEDESVANQEREKKIDDEKKKKGIKKLGDGSENYVVSSKSRQQLDEKRRTNNDEKGKGTGDMELKREEEEEVCEEKCKGTLADSCRMFEQALRRINAENSEDIGDCEKQKKRKGRGTSKRQECERHGEEREEEIGDGRNRKGKECKRHQPIQGAERKELNQSKLKETRLSERKLRLLSEENEKGIGDCEKQKKDMITIKKYDEEVKYKGHVEEQEVNMEGGEKQRQKGRTKRKEKVQYEDRGERPEYDVKDVGKKNQNGSTSEEEVKYEKHEKDQQGDCEMKKTKTQEEEYRYHEINLFKDCTSEQTYQMYAEALRWRQKEKEAGIGYVGKGRNRKWKRTSRRDRSQDQCDGEQCSCTCMVSMTTILPE